MKLDTLVLAVIAIFAVLWVVTAVTGLLTAVPYGWLGLIPIALVVGLVVTVIYQRVTNKEDNYYTKNVDK
ncbi:hypothetical protein [Cucumibacter marinus]|jgi:uncharacterized membrane protein (DUF485 family)|uniref:hypothetical protein n=1 Tax=Cucumibacter marinus TaxID=1121252 RepID=UPI00041A01AB|nr:hypothetical protein [Cucumibacter marinus]